MDNPNELLENIQGVIQSLVGNTIQDENIDEEFDSFTEVLSMPLDLFTLVAEQILEEHAKELNKPANKLLMIQSLKERGVKLEDFYKMCDDLMGEVQESLGDKAEQIKIDFLKRIIMNLKNSVTENDGISKRIVNIPIQKLHPEAVIPSYAHFTDAGLDVYTLEEYNIMPGETRVIPTGLRVALPFGYELQVRPRSGQSLKTKLRIANSPGTIDSGFRGEIGIIVDNIDYEIKNVELYNGELVIERGSPINIPKGHKIAQLVLSEVPQALFLEVEQINEVETDRSVNGFGSTDKSNG